jgi:hypothetical protein
VGKGRESVLKMSKTSTTTGTSSTEYGPLPRRIGDLKRERGELEEEIFQLRAAIRIWTEVWRQTMSPANRSEAFNSEKFSEEMR